MLVEDQKFKIFDSKLIDSFKWVIKVLYTVRSYVYDHETREKLNHRQKRIKIYDSKRK